MPSTALGTQTVADPRLGAKYSASASAALDRGPNATGRIHFGIAQRLDDINFGVSRRKALPTD